MAPGDSGDERTAMPDAEDPSQQAPAAEEATGAAEEPGAAPQAPPATPDQDDGGGIQPDNKYEG